MSLANLAGTKETQVYGAVEEELLITVDPYRTSAAGLTVRQVADIIHRSDTKVAAGRLRSASSDLIVEVDAELDSPERIARIPLKEADSGVMLRVGDIADVQKYVVDPPRTMAYHGSERTVFIKAKMEPNRQIDAWINNALNTVNRFETELPVGVRAEVVYNQNDYTSARMTNLTLNLISALIIVMAILIWFMGIRSRPDRGDCAPAFRRHGARVHEHTQRSLTPDVRHRTDHLSGALDRQRHRGGGKTTNSIALEASTSVTPSGVPSAICVFPWPLLPPRPCSPF